MGMANVRGDDGDCWVRALAGDASGLAELYDRHATSIFNHCLQRLASRADAEDITTEVFIVALKSEAQLHPHPEAGLRPWLLAVANNLLRQQARTLATSRRASRWLQRELHDLPDIADGVVERSTELHHLRIIRAILSELPVADQELIQLCVVQGIAPSVVAEITGTRAGTVRSRLSRALGRARSALTRYQDLSPTNNASSWPMATTGATITSLEFERGI